MAKKIIQNKITFLNLQCKKWKLITSKEMKQWIIQTIEQEQLQLGKVNVIFLSDEELLKINIDFLNHYYYTDVITFDYSTQDYLSGEICISIDTVKKNAEKYKQPFSKEIYRIIIHGILHLCKYKDKTKIEKNLMNQKENFYLQKIEKM